MFFMKTMQVICGFVERVMEVVRKRPNPAGDESRGYDLQPSQVRGAGIVDILQPSWI